MLEAVWEMMESYIIIIITYSTGACNPSKMELKNTSRIMEYIIGQILIYHPQHHVIFFAYGWACLT